MIWKEIEMPRLEIPSSVFEQMVSQARRAVPIEACGILAGRAGRVEKYYEMTNADKSATHFTMLPEEQFEVIKGIRATGLEMLAICHSHPATPARASAEDVRLALTQDVVYVVLSLQDADCPALKGFIIEDGSVTEMPVRIVNERNE